jgi:hypothetical protein
MNFKKNLENVFIIQWKWVLFYETNLLGSLLGIFLDKMNTKLPEVYKECIWFEQNKLMKPSEIMKKEFYKNKILKVKMNLIKGRWRCWFIWQ